MGLGSNRQNVLKQYITQAFLQYLGRGPTDTEIGMFGPSFGADPNIPDSDKVAGFAAIAQYATDQANLPANVRKKYTEQAGEYSGDVQGLFQDLMNRGATESELQHFGMLLASGEVDPYELRSFLEQTTEYQTAQDKAFRESLGEELTDLDTKAFGRQKEDVISRYAKMGRTGSSSLDFALTDLMGKIAEQRQGWLANLSASQYGSNKETAKSSYANLLNEMQTNQQRNWNLQDITRNRGWEVSDYNRQMSDWLRALEKQGQTSWIDSLNTGLQMANSAANIFKGWGK